MSDTKWTPGPWVVTDTCSNYVFNVVRIGNIDINVGTEENAHLIAAAPELYKALINVLGDYTDWDWHDTDWANEARRALAKARGES